MNTHALFVIATFAVALTVACGGLDGSGGASPSASDMGAYPDMSSYDSGYGPGSWSDSAASESWAPSDPGAPPLPPEKEKDYEFGAPEGSPNFVYIPSAGTDTIVKVHGQSLKVTLVEVGDRPTLLKVVPGKDAAVVLNSGSDNVSIIWSIEGEDDVAFVETTPHCNAIEVNPTGQWAVVYYDHDRAAANDPVGSFQTVSVVRLEQDNEKVITVSTGFRPRSVQFSSDGTKGLVVTDDGVSVMVFDDLVQDAIVAPVPLSDNPFHVPDEREVLATPDGKWVAIRTSELAGITLVNLETGAITDVPFQTIPTDLDLVPDGSAALAVLRESQEVALVPIPAAAADPEAAQTVFVGELIAGLSRITDDGKTAVLYTSVKGVEQVATLDLGTLELKPVLLRKTVDSVVIPPGIRRAILVHRAVSDTTETDEVEALVDKSEGYTMFDLDSGFTKLVLTPVKPAGIALSQIPFKAFLLLPDPSQVSHVVQEAHLITFKTRDFPLGSSPQYVRVLKNAGLAAVTQDHPSGRITFVDLVTGETKTVTGYELNGLVK